jgi:hypothetical protein
MILEAVYFKNGQEIEWIYPVQDIICDDNMKDISDIEIYNGCGWFSSKDFDEIPDDFVIRVKKSILSSEIYNYLANFQHNSLNPANYLLKN